MLRTICALVLVAATAACSFKSETVQSPAPATVTTATPASSTTYVTPTGSATTVTTPAPATTVYTR